MDIFYASFFSSVMESLEYVLCGIFLYEISKDYAIMMHSSKSLKIAACQRCDWQGRDNITGRLRSVLVVAGLLI